MRLPGNIGIYWHMTLELTDGKLPWCSHNLQLHFGINRLVLRRDIRNPGFCLPETRKPDESQRLQPLRAIASRINCDIVGFARYLIAAISERATC
jgi:hypothetical protein